MPQSKDATSFTEAANAALLQQLNWADTQDYELASRGFIATLNDPVIRDETGRPAWNLSAFAFLEAETAPASVNPSLWRQSRLNALYQGLFQVTDGIYQIRDFDLSVMTIIDTGASYIVIDPLVTPPTAEAGMALVYQHIGRKPIVAVIYTHSHIDHWGGVKGVISQADVTAGRVKIIAPERFMEFAISENVIAGIHRTVDDTGFDSGADCVEGDHTGAADIHGNAAGTTGRDADRDTGRCDAHAIGRTGIIVGGGDGHRTSRIDRRRLDECQHGVADDDIIRRIAGEEQIEGVETAVTVDVEAGPDQRLQRRQVAGIGIVRDVGVDRLIRCQVVRAGRHVVRGTELSIVTRQVSKNPVLAGLQLMQPC
ncbi:MAG: MBL fold metallo-hydrolase, partial [Chloroflexia bacterium]|nr:MBL fold metallo-hydrolase [Chloroflexia bacterium]